MTDKDEIELHRLCAVLERLEKLTEKDSEERKALCTAGYALHLAFIDGRRAELEKLLYPLPPTEHELDQLRRLGINPEA